MVSASSGTFYMPVLLMIVVSLALWLRFSGPGPDYSHLTMWTNQRRVLTNQFDWEDGEQLLRRRGFIFGMRIFPSCLVPSVFSGEKLQDLRSSENWIFRDEANAITWSLIKHDVIYEDRQWLSSFYSPGCGE